jgi:Tol biopolymer transport system component
MKQLKSILASCIIISFLLSSCNKNKDINRGCPMFGIVPQQPYDNPVWHPSEEIIGFNHRPIKEINYAYGYDCPMQASYTYEDDSSGFYLISADGTNQRRVLPYYLQTPSWSHDGNWIAFVNGEQIFKMPFDGNNFDTTAMEQLTFEGSNFFPDWSPNDEWISYDSNLDNENGMYFIWSMTMNGNNKKRITYAPNVGEIRMPSYNFEGKFIAHIRYVTGTDVPEIFIMDTVGNNLQRITNNNKLENYPKYNPLNNTIAYYLQCSIPKETGIWLHKAEQNAEPELLVSEAAIFSWSPDGKYIVYQYRANNYRIDEEKGTLWVINIDTKEKRQLTYNHFNLLIN